MYAPIKNKWAKKMDNKPFCSEDLNKKVIAYMGDSGFSFSNETAQGTSLENFSIVGGLFSTNWDLFDVDLKTINIALEELQLAGQQISSNPNFQFYNLMPPLKNDFMATARPDQVTEEHKTDVVVTCGLPSFGPKFDEDTQGYDNLSDIYQDRVNGSPEERLSQVSEYDSIMDNLYGWSNSAQAKGVRFIVTRGSPYELGTNMFSHSGDYKKLIETIEDYNHIDTYIPGGFGFLVAKDYAETAKQSANNKTLLGQRILSLN